MVAALYFAKKVVAVPASAAGGMGRYAVVYGRGILCPQKYGNYCRVVYHSGNS